MSRPTADDTEQQFSRRAFVARAVAATGTLAGVAAVVGKAGLAPAAAAATPGEVVETFNGLAAFVVPGPDPYSIAQGESTSEPGGVDAFAAPALIAGLDFSSPSTPELSSTVATLLNTAAQAVRPDSVAGPFTSAFANLSSPEKAAALALLETAEPFAPLRSLFVLLPSLVAFLAYSEVGVFDPANRVLAGIPIGWQLTNYEGVADGRDALLGYFENRRKVDA